MGELCIDKYPSRTTSAVSHKFDEFATLMLSGNICFGVGTAALGSALLIGKYGDSLPGMILSATYVAVITTGTAENIYRYYKVKKGDYQIVERPPEPKTEKNSHQVLAFVP